MILIYLIGAVTVILFLKFYLYKRRIMKYVGHLPSPPEVPFVGSGLYFIGKNSVGESRRLYRELYLKVVIFLLFKYFLAFGLPIAISITVKLTKSNIFQPIFMII